MIRICYRDFSAGTHDGTGLHGRAERCARGVTITLLPGLTTGQRRAVLRRLRQEASRGLGPRLPLSDLAIALGVDRVRTAFRVAGAVLRLHPAMTLVPGAFAAAVMALFVVAAAGGPGARPQAQPRLAEPPADRGSGTLSSVSVRPLPVQRVRVAVAVGPKAKLAARELGAGRRAEATPAAGQQPRRVKAPVRAVGLPDPRPGDAQTPALPVPRPRDGQWPCHWTSP